MCQLTTHIVLNVNQHKVIKIESSFCVSSVYVGKLLADLQKTSGFQEFKKANNETSKILTSYSICFPALATFKKMIDLHP